MRQDVILLLIDTYVYCLHASEWDHRARKIEMGIFIAHQCNATSTVCEALIHLIQTPTTMQMCKYTGVTTGRHTVYNVLCELCSKIRGTHSNLDIGSALQSRFCASNNKIFGEDKINEICSWLVPLCHEARDQMASINTSQLLKM